MSHREMRRRAVTKFVATQKLVGSSAQKRTEQRLYVRILVGKLSEVVNLIRQPKNQSSPTINKVTFCAYF
jgi:hypothetical protein